MDLRRLEYFLVVARLQHFGRAAEKLHVSQPGLSQQIKVLEQEMGAQLINRETKPISLTTAGEVLREHGQLLLAQVNLCTERVRTADEQPAGLLRVAYARSGGDLNMHKLVEKFRSLYPDVVLSLTSDWTKRNLGLLEAGEVDIAFARSLSKERAVDSMVIATEEIMVALPETHALAAYERVAIDDIVNLSLVHWPRSIGPEYYDDVKAKLWGDRRQKIVMEQPDTEHILIEVARGIGIAVVDERQARNLLPPGVCLRRFADPVPTTALSVVWMPESARSPAVNRFIEMCRTHNFQPPR